MKNTYFLFKKELKDSFTSPLVYVLAALFSLVLGWLFFNYIVLSKEMTSGTLVQAVLQPIFGQMNFIFIFFAPLLTMRSFAEEKKQNSLSLLLMSNCSHLEIILAKFLANLVVVIFLLALTLVFPIILSVSGYSNWGLIFSSYLGIILSVSCYLAVGLFASSLTENQIISAVISFCILLGLMLFVLAANASNNYILGQLLSYFSIGYHFEGFLRGALRSYDFVFFLSFIGFFTYLTNKSLDSRNW